MISQQYLVYGVACASCGQPAHHVEVYPNGNRTVHDDSRKRPCDILHAEKKQPDQRGQQRAMTTGAPALVRSQRSGGVGVPRPSTPPDLHCSRRSARVTAVNAVRR